MQELERRKNLKQIELRETESVTLSSAKDDLRSDSPCGHKRSHRSVGSSADCINLDDDCEDGASEQPLDQCDAALLATAREREAKLQKLKESFASFIQDDEDENDGSSLTTCATVSSAAATSRTRCNLWLR